MDDIGTEAWEVDDSNEWREEEKANAGLPRGRCSSRYYFHHCFLEDLEEHLHKIIDETSGPSNSWSRVSRCGDWMTRDQVRHLLQNFWHYTSYDPVYQMGIFYGRKMDASRSFRITHITEQHNSVKSCRFTLVSLDRIEAITKTPDIGSVIFGSIVDLASRGERTVIQSKHRNLKGGGNWIREHRLGELLDLIGEEGPTTLYNPYSSLQGDNGNTLKPSVKAYLVKIVESLTKKSVIRIDLFLNESGKVTPPHTDPDSLRTFLWLFGGCKLWNTCRNRPHHRIGGCCACHQFLHLQGPGQIVILGSRTKHSVVSLGPQDCWGVGGWLKLK